MFLSLPLHRAHAGQIARKKKEEQTSSMTSSTSKSNLSKMENTKEKEYVQKIHDIITVQLRGNEYEYAYNRDFTKYDYTGAAGYMFYRYERVCMHDYFIDPVRIPSEGHSLKSIQQYRQALTLFKSAHAHMYSNVTNFLSKETSPIILHRKMIDLYHSLRFRLLIDAWEDYRPDKRQRFANNQVSSYIIYTFPSSVRLTTRMLSQFTRVVKDYGGVFVRVNDSNAINVAFSRHVDSTIPILNEWFARIVYEEIDLQKQARFIQELCTFLTKMGCDYQYMESRYPNFIGRGRMYWHACNLVRSVCLRIKNKYAENSNQNIFDALCCMHDDLPQIDHLVRSCNFLEAIFSYFVPAPRKNWETHYSSSRKPENKFIEFAHWMHQRFSECSRSDREEVEQRRTAVRKKYDDVFLTMCTRHWLDVYEGDMVLTSFRTPFKKRKAAFESAQRTLFDMEQYRGFKKGEVVMRKSYSSKKGIIMSTCLWQLHAKPTDLVNPRLTLTFPEHGLGVFGTYCTALFDSNDSGDDEEVSVVVTKGLTMWIPPQDTSARALEEISDRTNAYSKAIPVYRRERLKEMTSYLYGNAPAVATDTVHFSGFGTFPYTAPVPPDSIRRRVYERFLESYRMYDEFRTYKDACASESSAHKLDYDAFDTGASVTDACMANRKRAIATIKASIFNVCFKMTESMLRVVMIWDQYIDPRQISNTIVSITKMRFSRTMPIPMSIMRVFNMMCQSIWPFFRVSASTLSKQHSNDKAFAKHFEEETFIRMMVLLMINNTDQPLRKDDPKVVRFYSSLMKGCHQPLYVDHHQRLNKLIRKCKFSKRTVRDVHKFLSWWVDVLADPYTCSICNETMRLSDAHLREINRATFVHSAGYVLQDAPMKCGHHNALCQDCLAQYASVSSKDRAKIDIRGGICCFVPHCKGIVGVPSLKKVLSRGRIQDVQQLIFNKTVELDKTATWCYNPACGGVCKKINDMEAVCNTCQEKTCAACSNKFHPSKTCAEADTDGIMQLKEREEWKSCPTCKCIVEKMSGCDHVTCKMCDQQFCYFCLAKADDNGDWVCNSRCSKRPAEHSSEEEEDEIEE